MSDQDLTLTVKADTADASSKLEGLGASIGKMTAAFTLGSLATRGIEEAWGFLKNTVTDSIAAWNESESVVAQMNATLESTQHAAGMSAQQLVALSAELEHTTRFSDEAVLSAENLLLTFTSIGKDIFPQATTAVLNMATALHEDAGGAAIQLGKALQDPILGVTALRRVGVNFNETQMETIKHLVETNKTLEAQKFILAELDKEFGGSAVAAAKTFGGQMEQLKNKVDDIEEGIGHGLTAALYNLMTAFGEATGGMGDNIDVGKTVFQVFAFIEEAAVNTGVGIYELAQAFVYLGSYIKEAADPLAYFDSETRRVYENFREETAKSMGSAADFAINLMDKNKKTADSFGQMTLDSREFAQKGPAAYQQTAQAAADAAKKIDDANKAIEDTKTKLADLQEGFLKGASDTATSYADAYVKQEQNVADIKTDIADKTAEKTKAIADGASYESIAGYDKDLNALMTKLAKEELALQNAANLKVSLGNYVAEAERRASETDFERTVEDIGAKYQEDVKAYLKKQKLLQQELADNEKKRLALADNEAKITATAIAETVKRTTQVQVEATKQVQAANQVASAWASAYSSMSSGNLGSGTTFTSTVPTINLSKHEFGGTVPGVKGEPTLIMAHGGETVIPAGQQSSGVGGGMVVNINYPSVRDDSDISLIRQQIEDVMRPLMNNAKLIYA